MKISNIIHIRIRGIKMPDDRTYSVQYNFFLADWPKWQFFKAPNTCNKNDQFAITHIIFFISLQFGGQVDIHEVQVKHASHRDVLKLSSPLMIGDAISIVGKLKTDFGTARHKAQITLSMNDPTLNAKKIVDGACMFLFRETTRSKIS